MSQNLCHNGSDVLMLGFDYELRRRGFAGNSCQIVLELTQPVDPAALEARLTKLVQQNPILCARPVRGFKPRWKPTSRPPQVRVHAPAANLAQQLFNEPLDIHRGELLRFDLIGRTLVFTWSHALMDAKSAEYFLAALGAETLPALEAGQDWYAQRAALPGNLRARAKEAWRELERLDQFRNALPVSLATQHPPDAKKMNYRALHLTAADTAQVHTHAARLAGFLGETTFHLAAALVELHQLHTRTGVASASYVIPVSVGLRPKGTRAPLFSNQITMLLHQFFPAQLADMPLAIAAIKTRKAESLRHAHIDAGIAMAQLFRALPLRLYMWLVKHELRGEICSLFFGDTGVADAALETFLGSHIESLVHVPAVTVPPGIGLVFYQFRNRLAFTLVTAQGTLTETEAEEFIHRLHTRLLNP